MNQPLTSHGSTINEPSTDHQQVTVAANLSAANWFQLRPLCFVLAANIAETRRKGLGPDVLLKDGDWWLVVGGWWIETFFLPWNEHITLRWLNP